MAILLAVQCNACYRLAVVTERWAKNSTADANRTRRANLLDRLEFENVSRADLRLPRHMGAVEPASGVGTKTTPYNCDGPTLRRRRRRSLSRGRDLLAVYTHRRTRDL